MSKDPSWPVEVAAVNPVDTGTVLWRKGGRLWLTILAKATFSFAPSKHPGGTMELVEPAPVRRSELNHGNNPMRSVSASSDTAPFLQYADVLFVGSAYAPAGRPAPSVTVRLGLARGAAVLLDKVLEVVGDRVATPGQPVPEPTPFTKLPLVYERAFGGLGSADNPLGVGLGLKKGRKEAMPNITYPDPAQREVPAGFGPISWYWPARKNLLRQHSRKLLDQRVAEIPDDFDAAYFQAAPVDQRVSFLRGDEIILLHGLHPSQPTLQMRLPQIRGIARVHAPNGAEVEIALNTDTLLIDGDAERLSITFRGVYPLGSEELLPSLRIFAGVEIGGRPIPWPAAQPRVDPAAHLASGDEIEIDELDLVDDSETTLPRSPSSPDVRYTPAPSVPSAGAAPENNWEATFAIATEEMKPVVAPFVAPFPIPRPAAGAPPQRAPAATPWTASPQATTPRPGPAVRDDKTAPVEGKTTVLSVSELLQTPLDGPAGGSVAMPEDNPWEGTFVLSATEVARPKAVATPFPIAAARAAPPPSTNQPIPGAPWSARPAPAVPIHDSPFEGTIALDASQRPAIPAAPRPGPPPAPPPPPPASAPASTRLSETPPLAAPKAPEPPPAPKPEPPAPKPSAPAQAAPAAPSKSWSWAEVAPPKVDEVPAKAPEPPPLPKPAVKKMLYGTFGPKKK